MFFLGCEEYFAKEQAIDLEHNKVLSLTTLAREPWVQATVCPENAHMRTNNVWFSKATVRRAKYTSLIWICLFHKINNKNSTGPLRCGERKPFWSVPIVQGFKKADSNCARATVISDIFCTHTVIIRLSGKRTAQPIKNRDAFPSLASHNAALQRRFWNLQIGSLAFQD